MFKDSAYARAIVNEELGEKASSVRRFLTGLSHFVYDVSTDSGLSYVVRIARPERTTEFESGIFWHKQIEDLGVRLPRILAEGDIDGHHYAIYERLKGDDLEHVYPFLTEAQKCAIAGEVAEIQHAIGGLDRRLFAKIDPWIEVLQGIIQRSEREILAYGLCNPIYTDIVRGEIERYSSRLQTLKPVPFVYDLGVRNVIVDDGVVSGIIDVDGVWFGDPLLAVGMGKTVLLAMRQDTRFIDYWCTHLELSEQEREIVDLYAMLYCLRFMGSIGTTLNGNVSIQTNPENATLFESLADRFLGA
jgi:Ser/Thr protein kinase RdoA (MazF antagonist)